jgi:hypothetical protein
MLHPTTHSAIAYSLVLRAPGDLADGSTFFSLSAQIFPPYDGRSTIMLQATPQLYTTCSSHVQLPAPYTAAHHPKLAQGDLADECTFFSSSAQNTSTCSGGYTYPDKFTPHPYTARDTLRLGRSPFPLSTQHMST